MKNLKLAMIALVILSPRIWAQDPPRFAPPRPPPLDQDFEDPGDDELENGDAPIHAQVPPPPVNNPPPAPANDFRPPQPSSTASGPDQTKVKFKVVDGAFYEKGKKRGRTPLNKRTE